MGSKRVAVDARHHMLGRLASRLAWSHPVSCSSNTLWRTIRGDEVKESRMSVLETKDGVAAFAGLKLKANEGIPAPYDKTKRMVIPDALNSRTWLSFTQSQSRLLELSPYHLSLTTYQDNTEPNLPHTEEKHSLQ
ncbi:hypothetical protein GOBAR_DD04621 [Gossypium barbadense]|nr:hypothetical protein GOBAR_DD04621 [Gossypium barbadense]